MYTASKQRFDMYITYYKLFESEQSRKYGMLYVFMTVGFRA